MEYVFASIAALLASALTFFSGFGLGTLLLPAFALFVPVRSAVVLTAVVHLLNSLFKVALVGRLADRNVIVRFGLPAVLAAYLGARALGWLSDMAPLAAYTLAGRRLEVTSVKLVIAVLMILFAFLEIVPRWNRFTLGARFLPLGGTLSGFFGGLSGHQGAFRSIFLLRSGLDKDAFVGTGAVIAALVDLSRLLVYQTWFSEPGLRENILLVGSAAAAALTGSLLGNRLLRSVTLRSIQSIVALMLAGIAVALALGLL